MTHTIHPPRMQARCSDNWNMIVIGVHLKLAPAHSTSPRPSSIRSDLTHAHSTPYSPSYLRSDINRQSAIQSAHYNSPRPSCLWSDRNFQSAIKFAKFTSPHPSCLRSDLNYLAHWRNASSVVIVYLELARYTTYRSSPTISTDLYYVDSPLHFIYQNGPCRIVSFDEVGFLQQVHTLQ